MTELKSETEQHWPPPHSTLLETALPSMHFSVKLQSHSANKWKARHLLLWSKPHHKQLPCRWCQQLASVMFPIAIVTRCLICFLSTSFFYKWFKKPHSNKLVTHSLTMLLPAQLVMWPKPRKITLQQHQHKRIIQLRPSTIPLPQLLEWWRNFDIKVLPSTECPSFF